MPLLGRRCHRPGRAPVRGGLSPALGTIGDRRKPPGADGNQWRHHLRERPTITISLLFSFAGPISINPLIHDNLPYDPFEISYPSRRSSTISSRLRCPHRPGCNRSIRSSRRRGTVPSASTGLPPQVSRNISFWRCKRRRADADASAVSRFRAGAAGSCRKPYSGIGNGACHHDAGGCKRQGEAVDGTNRQRSPIAPEVPTATEAGFPELTFDGVVGFFGRRDFPTAVRDRIANDVAAVGENSEVNRGCKRPA